MKNISKTIICFALVFTMAFLFIGCGESQYKNWETDIKTAENLGYVMYKSSDQDGALDDFNSDIKWQLNFENRDSNIQVVKFVILKNDDGSLISPIIEIVQLKNAKQAQKFFEWIGTKHKYVYLCGDVVITVDMQDLAAALGYDFTETK